MPPLTKSDVHVDAVLSNYATKQGLGGGFAMDAIAPPIPVKKDSDIFFTFNREELNADTETEVADRDFANETNWATGTDTYNATTHRLRQFLSDTVLENEDVPIRAKQRTTRLLVHQLKLEQERKLRDIVWDEANLANQSTPVVKWDAASGVLIEQDIDDARELFESVCGFDPTHIVIPSNIAKVIKRDATVRDLLRHTHSDLVTNGDLPSKLWNLNVIIPGALENTAAAGQTVAIGKVWQQASTISGNTFGDNVALIYVNPENAIDTITAVKQFQPSNFGTPYQVETYREPGRRGMFLESLVKNDMKLIDEGCIHLIFNVLT